MKTTCLLLSSVLLLGCLSACNIFTQKQKTLKTNDGSITTVETGGNELTVCDFVLAKDTIDVPLSEFVEDCRIIRFDNSDSAMFKAGSHSSPTSISGYGNEAADRSNSSTKRVNSCTTSAP